MIYFSRLFINRLLSISDIVDVISSKLSLKKTGRYYKSFCPFHKEKNPSFFVNKEKKIFYCFGCKCYGNIIDFLMKINNYNFIDAIKELSNINNISLENYNIKDYNYNNRKIFYKLIFNLNKIYIKSLFLNLNIKYIKDFLLNRNIDYNCIYNFSIGFSYTILVNKFINNLDFKYRIFLFKLGFLLKDKNGNFFDRLYNRIIFPIYNINGNIIAFGGRSIKKKNFCKYINSCNSIYFSKKKCLYNLFNIINKNNNIKLDKILVVEGYMDVIMLSKFGINYCVALLGSNIFKEQIDILYFYTNKIIFCLDGDKSNYLFIKNIIDLLIFYINKNIIFFFIFLPYGEDPDSLIKKEGKILFEKRIKDSLSIFDVIFKFFNLNNNLYTYDGQISFISSILPIIYKINCPIIRNYLRQKVSNKVGILDNKFLEKFLEFNKKHKKIKITILRCLISLLLKYPYLSNKVNLYDKLFYNKNIIPGLFLFLDIVNLCINNKNITINEIISKYNNNIKNYLIKLFLWNYFPKNINFSLIFDDSLIKLKVFIVKKILKNILINNNLYELTLNQKIKIWNLIKFNNLNL